MVNRQWSSSAAYTPPTMAATELGTSGCSPARRTSSVRIVSVSASVVDAKAPHSSIVSWGRAIGRVDRARDAATSEVRFDVGQEISHVGHAIAFLYSGPDNSQVQVCRAQIRRRTTQRLLSNDAGRSPVPQHDCPNGR